MTPKKTTELAAGDIVIVSGVYLRLTECTSYMDSAKYGSGMMVYSWKTEYVSGETDSLGGYGVWMRNNEWTIQDNDRASWMVVS